MRIEHVGEMTDSTGVLRKTSTDELDYTSLCFLKSAHYRMKDSRSKKVRGIEKSIKEKRLLWLFVKPTDKVRRLGLDFICSLPTHAERSGKFSA